MIQKMLIANRGEIACRIMRTCRALGIRTVAVYSEVDQAARHVQEADEAVALGGVTPAESYLHIEKVLAAAQQAGVEAIHPGFGFLAENATFAQACVTAGFIFIGPSAAAIAAMGHKSAAKRLMETAVVPTIPGYQGSDQSVAAFATAAETIGYPVMIKAAAGGGGKGMRLVHTPAELPDALAGAQREAGQAFGVAELLLEKALIRPRHIEVQIFGDHHGQIIHLGERECSIQRRHQKIIEESPAPGLTAELRAALGAAAVRAAQSVGYTNAGTVEFLLDSHGRFYFLEMNTRIQVEHPVTELVTGLDLVAWQIRVAEGDPLPLTQAQVTFQGHAVEARLYAEDPAQGFLPVNGRIALWREPVGEGVRVDSGLCSQDMVSIYYDPMLAKVIAHGPDRKTAVRRLRRSLAETRLLGLTSNLPFLQAVLQHPAFLAGETHTGFLGDHFPAWQPAQGDVTWALLAAAVAQFLRHPPTSSGLGYWRNSPNRPLLYRFAGQPDVWLTVRRDGLYGEVAGQGYLLLAEPLPDGDLALTINGRRQRVTPLLVGEVWWVAGWAGVVTLTAISLLPKPEPPADAGGSLRAPMPGVVTAVLVAVGQVVEKGQPLMKLEAMKMEHTIRSAAAGVVTAIYFAAGEQVEADAHLLEIS